MSTMCPGLKSKLRGRCLPKSIPLPRKHLGNTEIVAPKPAEICYSRVNMEATNMIWVLKA